MNQASHPGRGLLCAAALLCASCSKKRESPSPEAPAKSAENAVPKETPAEPPEAAPLPLPIKADELILEEETSTTGMVVLDNGELDEFVAFDKHLGAEALCTDDAIANPDGVRIYRIAGRPEIVFLCAPTMDGFDNGVAVFSAGAEPRTRKVEPEASSHMITEAVLKTTVFELLAE